jgi:hypothetical protein
MSGNISLSLSEFDSCDKTTSNKMISDKCCNFNHISFDFDYDTSVDLKTFKSTITSSFAPETNFALQDPVFKTDNFNNYTNLPPPSGIELIKRVQVFRL